ncbi:efb6c869-e10b-4306-a9b9-7bda8d414611 [Thermothielavioides terrestris]|uniref:Efb6c869-e10b-4306-a9b9-7bda8d414611 n=1 Tax=Thermothielavioides terrestris TaxID=2587410 RepID=A0A446BKQ4_9PEZI|nr:efb6c869-e10b-4306-a9b9-7bda8d414611 [Thermothielavioides terrestris]
MAAPLPSPTATWHTATYPAISPLRPELSQKGRTVVITGAGTGVGRQTALAFAQAGAARLVLLGRTASTLEGTASLIAAAHPAGGPAVEIHVVDITDEAGLARVAAAVGAWDVLLLNAVYGPPNSTIASANVDKWWQSFETNVKGPFLTIRAFLPTANRSGDRQPAVIALTTGMLAVPLALGPLMSGYTAAKMAQLRVIEYLAAEHPDLFVASAHPGMYDTPLLASMQQPLDGVPLDDISLAGDFLVWMASPEAAFLRGRLAWANWDVEELKQQAESIQAGPRFTTGIVGWP